VERENGPAKFDPVLPLQTVGTHGTEIAPGSDIVEKDLDDGRFVHGMPPWMIWVNLNGIYSRNGATNATEFKYLKGFVISPIW
jgi:hypothetical protein